jgi:alpha-galactosidase
VPGADLGGNVSASPALVRIDDTHASVFARGANGSLHQQTLDGTTWSQRWNDLGGPTHGKILGQPSAFASAGGRLDVFVRGLDNAAYQRTFRNGRWDRWVNLGGRLTDSPSVAFTSPQSWSLFTRGQDGLVWTRAQSGGWSSVSAPNGKAIYGRPGAANDGTATHIAIRAADDSVWTRSRDNATGVWSEWSGIGGVISGSPTLVATLGRVYLFARAGDYTLWQVNHADGAWQGWFKRGEYASNSLVGAVGAAAGDNGSAWLAVRGPDNRVHQAKL